MTTTLKLYEIVDALTQIGEELISNGGELTPELENELKHLDLAFEDKVENVVLYARTLELSAAAAQSEARRLGALAASLDAAARRLKDYTQREMERSERPEVETDRVCVSVVKNSRPTIAWLKGIAELPQQFLRVKEEVDLQLAYEEWKKDGSLPPGFAVTQSSHLRIR